MDPFRDDPVIEISDVEENTYMEAEMDEGNDANNWQYLVVPWYSRVQFKCIMSKWKIVEIENNMNTLTGALTNPKNLNLNKTLNLNVIEIWN